MERRALVEGAIEQLRQRPRADHSPTNGFVFSLIAHRQAAALVRLEAHDAISRAWFRLPPRKATRAAASQTREKVHVCKTPTGQGGLMLDYARPTTGAGERREGDSPQWPWRVLALVADYMANQLEQDPEDDALSAGVRALMWNSDERDENAAEAAISSALGGPDGHLFDGGMISDGEGALAMRWRADALHDIVVVTYAGIEARVEWLCARCQPLKPGSVGVAPGPELDAAAQPAGALAAPAAPLAPEAALLSSAEEGAAGTPESALRKWHRAAPLVPVALLPSGRIVLAPPAGRSPSMAPSSGAGAGSARLRSRSLNFTQRICRALAEPRFRVRALSITSSHNVSPIATALGGALGQSQSLVALRLQEATGTMVHSDYGNGGALNQLAATARAAITLTESACSALGAGLGKSHSLRYFALANMQLADCAALAAGLRQNASLTCLNLSSNVVSLEQAKALVHTLDEADGESAGPSAGARAGAGQGGVDARAPRRIRTLLGIDTSAREFVCVAQTAGDFVMLARDLRTGAAPTLRSVRIASPGPLCASVASLPQLVSDWDQGALALVRAALRSRLRLLALRFACLSPSAATEAAALATAEWQAVCERQRTGQRAEEAGGSGSTAAVACALRPAEPLRLFDVQPVLRDQCEAPAPRLSDAQAILLSHDLCLAHEGTPHARTITALMLANRQLGDAAGLAIARCIAAAPQLDTLDLIGNKFSTAAAAAIVRAATARAHKGRSPPSTLCGGRVRANRMAELEAGCNDSDAHMLAYDLQLPGVRPPALTLRNSYVSDSGASALSRALQAGLHTFELSLGCVGDEGALSLARMLVSNRTLKRLLLAHNVIGPVGATALSQAAGEQVERAPGGGLELLDLRHNPCAELARDWRDAALAAMHSAARAAPVAAVALDDPASMMVEAVRIAHLARNGQLEVLLI